MPRVHHLKQNALVTVWPVVRLVVNARQFRRNETPGRQGVRLARVQSPNFAFAGVLQTDQPPPKFPQTESKLALADIRTENQCLMK